MAHLNSSPLPYQIVTASGMPPESQAGSFGITQFFAAGTLNTVAFDGDVAEGKVEIAQLARLVECMICRRRAGLADVLDYLEAVHGMPVAT